MNNPTPMSELFEILSKIQQELKAPKSQYNSFSNFYYRNCEDIMEAVKPLLGHLVLRVEDDIVQVGDRYYVKATAILTDGIKEIRNSAFARESLVKKGMDESQITGATSSYARKYALNGLFAIDDTKDADSRNNTEVKVKPSTDPKKMIADPATIKQVGMIHQLLVKKGQEKANLYKKYKVESVSELSKAVASQVIDNLMKLDDVEVFEDFDEDVSPEEIKE